MKLHEEISENIDTIGLVLQSSYGMSTHRDASVSTLSSIYSVQHSHLDTAHDEYFETSIRETSNGTQSSQEIL